MPPLGPHHHPTRNSHPKPLKHCLLRILGRPGPYSSPLPRALSRSWYPEISYRATELCYDPRCEPNSIVFHMLCSIMDDSSHSSLRYPSPNVPPSRSARFHLGSFHTSIIGYESTSFSISSRLTADNHVTASHTHSISLLLSAINKHRLREGEVAYDPEVRFRMSL
ncbi:hypothetical protein Hypma_014429 [Hypsizygus marmoreus]|uniref:Uncharacterized protein n=1 Tax=Hypsizygus marmoreus TaxID=39966 RepID=A0A369JAJ1_HYPMA|nr:hypothetical protein Hypma_014429 [Hypsizygus marmoreus]